jgi:ABC-type bacteriocin/lantibiotic exporter with double-glycine peptidase domain
MSYYYEIYTTYLRFLQFLKPYWKAGVITGFLMLLTVLLQLPTPLLTKYLIDNIVPAQNLKLLNIFALLLVLIIVLNNVISYLESYMLVTYRNKVEFDIRKQLFQKILLAKQSYLDKQKTGYVDSRIDSDVNAVGNLFMETLLDLIIDMLTFIVGVGLLFYLNKILAIVSLLSLPLFIISFHVFSKKLNSLMEFNQEKWAELRGSTVEYITQTKTIKAFNKVELIYKLFVESLKDAIKSNKTLELYNVISGIAIGLTGALLPLFVLWYGIRQIILGYFTLGGFIAFNTCIGYLYGPVQNFVSLNIDLHSAIAAAKRIFEIIDLPEENVGFGINTLEQVTSIRFEDVTYYYNTKEKRGIRGISFNLYKGKTLAIVGETGKGKSTIAKLILGFDLPKQGKILINNISYVNYSLSSIRDKIGYVPQEPELFSATILDNITFLSEHPDMELVKTVVEICCLTQTIQRLLDGLQTNVFESGIGLSGGEKQRIAIARALYKQPDILIFDEATSAIDTKTEATLLKNLLNMKQKPGIFFITHRLSLVGRMHNVLDLNTDFAINNKKIYENSENSEIDK